MKCFVIRKSLTKAYFDGFGAFAEVDERHHPYFYETKSLAENAVTEYGLDNVFVEEVTVNFS